MYDVCMRKPEISSFMSRIVSRSRKQYMSIDIAPSSSPLVPIHTRCEERRGSPATITRRGGARGGAPPPPRPPPARPKARVVIGGGGKSWGAGEEHTPSPPHGR